MRHHVRFRPLLQELPPAWLLAVLVIALSVALPVGGKTFQGTAPAEHG